jgi:hypothetical protein
LGWPTNFMDWIRATIKLLNVSWFCTRMHVYLLLKFIRCQFAPSLGCPTVSPQFLQTLKTYIDRSGKPVLLYIYR